MSSKMSIQEHMELAMMEKRYKSLPFLATDEAKLKEWIGLVKKSCSYTPFISDIMRKLWIQSAPMISM